jgi:hypothetical protein
MFQRKNNSDEQPPEVHPCARAYLQERLSRVICQSDLDGKPTQDCRDATLKFMQFDKECEEANKQAGLPKLVLR